MPPNGLCLELFSGTAPLARASLRMGYNCISIDKFSEQTKNAYDITIKFVKELEKEEIEEEKEKKKENQHKKKILESNQKTDEEVVEKQDSHSQLSFQSEKEMEIIPETQQSQGTQDEL